MGDYRLLNKSCDELHPYPLSKSLLAPTDPTTLGAIVTHCLGVGVWTPPPLGVVKVNSNVTCSHFGRWDLKWSRTTRNDTF